jgi:uncharacterized protein (DUF2237 family)
MTGSTAADTDRIPALGFEIKQSVESYYTVHLRQRDVGLCGDIFQHIGRKILTRIMILDFLQDTEQRAGAALVFADDTIRELPVVSCGLRWCLGGFHGHILFPVF